MEPDEEEMVEVYRCSTELEANRAIVEVLGPEAIEAYLRDRVSRALPAPDAEPGGLFIAVPDSQAARARELLREALEDGALDGDEGEVIESESGEGSASA
jgi:hypothetical protein